MVIRWKCRRLIIRNVNVELAVVVVRKLNINAVIITWLPIPSKFQTIHEQTKATNRLNNHIPLSYHIFHLKYALKLFIQFQEFIYYQTFDMQMSSNKECCLFHFIYSL